MIELRIRGSSAFAEILTMDHKEGQDPEVKIARIYENYKKPISSSTFSGLYLTTCPAPSKLEHFLWELLTHEEEFPDIKVHSDNLFPHWDEVSYIGYMTHVGVIHELKYNCGITYNTVYIGGENHTPENIPGTITELMFYMELARQAGDRRHK